MLAEPLHPTDTICYYPSSTGDRDRDRERGKGVIGDGPDLQAKGRALRLSSVAVVVVVPTILSIDLFLPLSYDCDSYY